MGVEEYVMPRGEIGAIFTTVGKIEHHCVIGAEISVCLEFGAVDAV
jgi:hypothetical protein